MAKDVGQGQHWESIFWQRDLNREKIITGMLVCIIISIFLLKSHKQEYTYMFISIVERYDTYMYITKS